MSIWREKIFIAMSRNANTASSHFHMPPNEVVDLIDAAHPISAVELPRPMFLVCQALPNGWIAHAHHATADGQPGEAIGSHRI